MEKIIDINDIYDVINSISSVVRNSRNPKPMGSSKHDKAQEITDKMKYAWNSYVEAVAIESILSRCSFKDALSPKGQAIYKELSDIASKKDKYLENFKSLIEKQKLGLFDEMNITSTNYIRYELNENREMEYVLHEAKDRKSTQSVTNSLNAQGKGMLNLLENLVNERKFARPTPQETEARITELSKKSESLDYSNLKNTLKTDLDMKLDTANLDNIKLNHDRLTRQLQSIDEVSKLFEKYRNYITSETFLKIVSLSEELNKAKSQLSAKQEELTNGFKNEKDKISEKIFGNEKSNRINAILSMLTRGADAEGKELSSEQKASLMEELTKMQNENPQNYKEASTTFDRNEEARKERLSYEFAEKAKNKLDDSELSMKEQTEKAYYYNLFVASEGLDVLISASKFSMIYDKYLKMGQNEPYLLNELVHAYLGYVNYIEKMKEQNEEPAFTNWEEFANNMLAQKEYDKTEGR